MNNIWQNKNIKPMLLEEIDKPFNEPHYIFEPKYDGIRAIIYVSSNSITIKSRNNMDITHLFPELEKLKQIVKKKVVFDGEIISLENNLPSFSKLLTRLHLKNKDKIMRVSNKDPIVFMAFDILYENKSLLNKPLSIRKKHLDLYSDTTTFIKVPYLKKDGIKFFSAIKKLKLEGMVAKNINSLYYPGKRTSDFIKIKNIKDDLFVIIGYIENKNNTISLLLGNKQKGKLIYVGKVTMNKKEKLYNLLKKEKKITSDHYGLKENANYIVPKYICKVSYLEKTSTNHLRHPIYVCFMKGKYYE